MILKNDTKVNSFFSSGNSRGTKILQAHKQGFTNKTLFLYGIFYMESVDYHIRIYTEDL